MANNCCGTMQADKKTKTIREIVESAFKDILGPELFAVHQSYIISLAEWFDHEMECVCENRECGQTKRRMDLNEIHDHGN